MSTEEVRKKFKEWWPSAGQTIGEAAAWLAWQEQEKRIAIVSGVLGIMNATCAIANDVLEEQTPKITEMKELIAEQRIRIAFLQKQADRLDGLRKLCGYIQDGSHVTVYVGQDDATGEWCVGLDRKHLAHGENFNSAIDEAVRKDNEVKDD